MLFGGSGLFFRFRAFFGVGPCWGTWTSHHGADQNLKQRNFPPKKRYLPPKKRENKSGWQAFPSSQNPNHETALFFGTEQKFPKQQKKVLFDNFAQPEVLGMFWELAFFSASNVTSLQHPTAMHVKHGPKRQQPFSFPSAADMHIFSVSLPQMGH